MLFILSSRSIKKQETPAEDNCKITNKIIYVNAGLILEKLAFLCITKKISDKARDKNSNANPVISIPLKTPGFF